MSWKPILAVLARLAALGVVFQVGTIWVCSSWFWSPIQRHYLPTYFWSSLPVVAPSTIEVRMIWKTRPHRKPELASQEDAVASAVGTGMAISQWARDASWTGVMVGSPQQVSTAILRPGLADLAFDGESFWDFLLLPEACGIAVLLVTIFGLFCLKGWCQFVLAELAWRRRASVSHQLSPSIFEEWTPLARQVCSGLRRLHESAVRRIATRSASTSAAAALVEPPVEAAVFAFPLFGVPNRTGNSGHLWSQRDEIE